MSASDVIAAIREGLRDSANLFEREVRAKISSEKKLSSKIADGIRQEGPFSSSVGFAIDIYFDAPMSRAYEFGSGEHATRGKVGRYRIPREGGGDFVAFPLERWSGYEPPPDKQSFVFPFVMHPGVRPVPYVAPTMIKVAPEIAKIVGEAMLAAYIGDKKVIEIHAK